MFELFLTKIRILDFKIQSLGRAKRKGVGVPSPPGIFARPRLEPVRLWRNQIFPTPPNFVFCFAKCATKEDVALDPPNPFAGDAKELPKDSFTKLFKLCIIVVSRNYAIYSILYTILLNNNESNVK